MAASDTVDAFFMMLRASDGASAWRTLGPATQEHVYDFDDTAFLSDIAESDMSASEWSVASNPSPTWTGVSWLVYVDVTGGAATLPDFLVTKRLVSPWSVRDNAGDGSVGHRGVIVQVMAHEGAYAVEGVGLASAQRNG